MSDNSQLMLEHRPSPAYVLLLIMALAAWCLHSPMRLPLAGLLLAAVLLSYRFKSSVLRPGLLSRALTASLCFTFFQFIYFAGQAQTHVSIYPFQTIESLGVTLQLMIGLQWYSWRSRQFDWMLLLIGLLMMFSGISWQTLTLKPAYVALALLFTGFLLFSRLFPGFKPHYEQPFKGDKRLLRSYYTRMAVVLSMMLVLSVAGIRSMELLDQHFSEMLTRFLMGDDSAWSGFSGHTHLQGGKEIQLSDKIAFTVTTSRPLDYWRGNILTVYRDGHWFPQEALHLPVPAPAGKDPAWERYYVTGEAKPPAPEPDTQTLDVQMQNAYQGILFAPSGTRQVEVPAEASLYQNQYQLYRRELKEREHHYRLQVSRDDSLPAHWDPNILNENLELQPRIRAQLEPLARQVTGHAILTRDKATRLESWFRDNFTYSLRVAEVPPGVDPSVDFVLSRKPAYCSWFASGMVLMLRSLDIPAHVVSGWRSMDYNPLAGVWVVKEKEAHDWVEVLDTDSGQWLRFDPTPPGQLAELTGSGQPAWWRQLGDGLGILTQRLQQQLSNMSLQQRLDWVRTQAMHLLSTPAFYIVLVLFLGLNQLLKWRKRPLPAIPKMNVLSYAEGPFELKSALELLGRWLSTRGHSLPDPASGMSLDSWYAGVSRQLEPHDAASLAEILALIQAQRFGPEPALVAPVLAEKLAALTDNASPEPFSAIEK